MSKKAKYTGGSDGLEVSWFDEHGFRHTVEVERGHELPEEFADGHPIPAAVRDELLSRDDWSEVRRSSGGKGE